MGDAIGVRELRRRRVGERPHPALPRKRGRAGWGFSRMAVRAGRLAVSPGGRGFSLSCSAESPPQCLWLVAIAAFCSPLASFWYFAFHAS